MSEVSTRGNFIEEIPLDRLYISKGNIRKFQVEAEALLPSIRSGGIKTPLQVYPAGEKYAIWNGQRRFLAAKTIGLSTVPCIIYANIKSDDEAEAHSLADTLHSKEIHPLDKARAISGMKVRLGSLQKVSEALNIPLATLSQYNSLNELTPEVKAMMTCDEPLPYRKAIELAKLPQDKQLEVAKQINKIKGDEEWRALVKQGSPLSETRHPLLLSLPKALFDSLRVQARNKGLSLDKYALEVLERHVPG